MYRRLACLPLLLLLLVTTVTSVQAQDAPPLSRMPVRLAVPSVRTLPEAGAIATSIALGAALGLAVRKGRRRNL